MADDDVIVWKEHSDSFRLTFRGTTAPSVYLNYAQAQALHKILSGLLQCAVEVRIDSLKLGDRFQRPDGKVYSIYSLRYGGVAYALEEGTSSVYLFQADKLVTPLPKIQAETNP